MQVDVNLLPIKTNFYLKLKLKTTNSNFEIQNITCCCPSMSQLPTRNSEAKVSSANFQDNNSQRARPERQKTDDEATQEEKNKSSGDKQKILQLYANIKDEDEKQKMEFAAWDWINETDYKFEELLDIIEKKDGLKEFLEILIRNGYCKSEDDEDEDEDDADEDDEDDDIDDENEEDDDDDDENDEEDVD